MKTLLFLVAIFALPACYENKPIEMPRLTDIENQPPVLDPETRSKFQELSEKLDKIFRQDARSAHFSHLIYDDEKGSPFLAGGGRWSRNNNERSDDGYQMYIYIKPDRSYTVVYQEYETELINKSFSEVLTGSWYISGDYLNLAGLGFITRGEDKFQTVMTVTRSFNNRPLIGPKEFNAIGNMKLSDNVEVALETKKDLEANNLVTIYEGPKTEVRPEMFMALKNLATANPEPLKGESALGNQACQIKLETTTTEFTISTGGYDPLSLSINSNSPVYSFIDYSNDEVDRNLQFVVRNKIYAIFESDGIISSLAIEMGERKFKSITLAQASKAEPTKLQKRANCWF